MAGAAPAAALAPASRGVRARASVNRGAAASALRSRSLRSSGAASSRRSLWCKVSEQQQPTRRESNPLYGHTHAPLPATPHPKLTPVADRCDCQAILPLSPHGGGAAIVRPPDKKTKNNPLSINLVFGFLHLYLPRTRRLSLPPSRRRS
jgi:hypothetical protein